MTRFWLVSSMLLFGVGAAAAEPPHAPVSKYAGQESRTIKSLSEEDIAELNRGGGWGLAKAAELNGVPGPAHLLELKDQIPLRQEQVAAVTQIFQTMRDRAVEQGKHLISLERRLDEQFQKREVTDRSLYASLEQIAAARRELRFTHLRAHLEMSNILSEDQISRYNALRGYASQDPCAHVPDGHDSKAWRQHNNCN